MLSFIGSGLGMLSGIGSVLEALSGARRRKWDRTADFIGPLSTGRLARADAVVARMIASGARFPDDRSIKPRHEQYLITLLDYYELIATFRRSLDEDMLFHLRGGAMVRAYEMCEGYIHARRARVRNPALYKNFEALALEFKARMHHN